MAETKKILIAEDEKAIAQALKLKLTGAGFDVTVASNGEEAIDALRADGFALALLDLVMPKKDGFAVLEDLRDSKSSTKAIVLTNLSQQEDVKRAKALGAIDCFIKSDTPLAEIVTVVKKLLT